MEVTNFWNELNNDIARLQCENVTSIVSKYLNVFENPIWADEFILTYGVHKSICVRALCNELSEKCALTSIFEKNGTSIKTSLNIIAGLKDTLTAIQTLQSIRMD